MYISRLTLYQFRNLSDQTIHFDSGPVFITGDNGNGKTNLVESIYVLSGSRSFRTNSSSDFVRWGSESSSVFGAVNGKLGELEVGVSFLPKRRAAFVDGKELTSFDDLVGRVPIVSFAPPDLQLVKGSPAGRRKFLDRHMADIEPSFLKVLVHYQRALDNKNALLKDRSPTRDELSSWNALLSQSAAEITRARRRFLEALQVRAAEHHQRYAPSGEDFQIGLSSDLKRFEDPTPDAIYAYLEEHAGREIATRTSVIGPHRDDVDITLSEVDARAFASQGQTRSIVLSLKLGVIDMVQTALGEAPMVLLDDVDSELDRARSDRLFSHLAKTESQLFVTGTGEPPPELRKVHSLQLLRVEKGSVEKV